MASTAAAVNTMGRIGSQLVVLRVQLRQHLHGPDLLAQFSLPLDDLAADPKTRSGLDFRPGFSRIFAARRRGADTHSNHFHGPHRLLWRRGFGAGGHENGDDCQGINDFFHGLIGMRTRAKGEGRGRRPLET